MQGNRDERIGVGQQFAAGARHPAPHGRGEVEPVAVFQRMHERPRDIVVAHRGAGPVIRWMARAGRELLADADALIPVPLHWRRLWTRRFNQSALLAKAIGQENGIAVADTALKRVKATAQQVGLSQAERAQNVQGAFRVPTERKAEVAGRRLILIDDVLTSGATSDACARALLRAGARSVDLLVFARVVDAVRATI
jgi:ComF family protein